MQFHTGKPQLMQLSPPLSLSLFLSSEIQLAQILDGSKLRPKIAEPAKCYISTIYYTLSPKCKSLLMAMELSLDTLKCRQRHYQGQRQINCGSSSVCRDLYSICWSNNINI